MDNNKTHKKKFKLLFLGNSTVGKTSILQRFIGEPFEDKRLLTVGIDQVMKYIEINKTKIKLQICDTAGQERFHSIAKNYMRGGHGFIFVYAVNDRESFKGIRKWIKEAQKLQSIKPFQMILVGNKCDLVNVDDTARNKEVEVTQEELKQLSKEYGVLSVETSAKHNINVDIMFQQLLTQLIKHQNELHDVNLFGEPGLFMEDIESKASNRSNNINSRKKCEC